MDEGGSTFGELLTISRLLHRLMNNHAPAEAVAARRIGYLEKRLPQCSSLSEQLPAELVSS
jgi:hypothetical protein